MSDHSTERSYFLDERVGEGAHTDYRDYPNNFERLLMRSSRESW